MEMYDSKRAAAFLGIHERTLQKIASTGRIRFELIKKQGVVKRIYNGDDLKTVKTEKETGQVIPKALAKTKTLPAERLKNAAVPEINPMEVFKLLCDEFRAQRKEDDTIRERQRAQAFLTLQEAAAYKRLPKAYLLRAIAEERLPAIKAGGWRIHCATLEAFQG